MKKSGCFFAAGLVVVASCVLALVVTVGFLRLRAEALQKERGPQLETILVPVASLPSGSYQTIGEGQIVMAAFSPDGQTLATATTRGLVFYGTDGFQPRLFIPIGHIDELAWSPDAKMLAIAGHSVGLGLFDPTTGKQIRTLDIRDQFPRNLAWSPDSRYLAATMLGMYREDVWGWDAQTGEQAFELPDGSQRGLAFAQAVRWAAGNRLAIAYSYSGLGEPLGGRDEIRIWQIGPQPELVNNWPIEGVSRLAWAADGRSLVVLGSFAWRVFDSQSGATLAEIEAYPGPALFAPSPDGTTLAAEGNYDGTIHFFDLSTLKHTGQIQTQLLSIGSLDWSADGASIVATQEYADRFQVWSWPDGRLLADVSTANPGAETIAWSPDSRSLAMGAKDGLTHVYDSVTGERSLTVGEAQRGEASPVAWSFDGKLLATTSAEEAEDGRRFTTHLWSPEGELKASIAGDLIAWANHSNRLMVVYRGTDNKYWVQVWAVEEAADGQITKQAEFQTDGLDRWAWSPDESLIAGVDQQYDSTTHEIYSRVVILEMESQRQVAELVGAAMSYVRSLAWSPDGAWLAAAYDYNCRGASCARLEVWDTATWQSYKTFGRMEASSAALSWSADSRWIVADESPAGPAIAFYPLDAQQHIRELDHPMSVVSVVAWSPDGRKLASTSYDGRLTIWDAGALLP